MTNRLEIYRVGGDVPRLLGFLGKIVAPHLPYDYVVINDKAYRGRGNGKDTKKIAIVAKPRALTEGETGRVRSILQQLVDGGFNPEGIVPTNSIPESQELRGQMYLHQALKGVKDTVSMQ